MTSVIRERGARLVSSLLFSFRFQQEHFLAFYEEADTILTVLLKKLIENQKKLNEWLKLQSLCAPTSSLARTTVSVWARRGTSSVCAISDLPGRIVLCQWANKVLIKFEPPTIDINGIYNLLCNSRGQIKRFRDSTTHICLDRWSLPFTSLPNYSGKYQNTLRN